MINIRGIYLIAPYGKHFADGKISAFVKDIDLPIKNHNLYLCSKKYAYGIIKVKDKALISLQQFRRLWSEHKIEELYRMIWWKNRKTLYYYPFETIKIFKEPIPYKYKGNKLSIIENVEFDMSLNELDNKELMFSYITLSTWNKMLDDGRAIKGETKEETLKKLNLVKQELDNRNIKIPNKDFDIKDVLSYNPNKENSLDAKKLSECSDETVLKLYKTSGEEIKRRGL